MTPTPSIKESVPLNIITGFLGVGKTTAILSLLRNRPEGAPWAVLVNEFGKVPIDQAALRQTGTDGVEIAEVAGGCLCCAAGVDMQLALREILEQVNPTRILLEPTGLGHPQRLRELLEASPLPLRIAGTVCLLDPRQFIDPRYENFTSYLEQVRCADRIVLNKCDLARAEELTACRAKLTCEFPDQGEALEVIQGELPAAALEAAGTTPQSSRHQPHPAHAPEETETGPEEVPGLGGRATRQPSRGLDHQGCGWIFDRELLFNLQFLTAYLEKAQVPFVRVKGVFHTPEGARLFNAVNGEVQWSDHPGEEDSRVEFISSENHNVNWTPVETGLLNCLEIHEG